MKKILLLLGILAFLVGCGDNKKIDEFMGIAEGYINNEDYENAVLTYNKILDIKELPDVRQKIKEANAANLNKQLDIVKQYRSEGSLEEAIALLNKVLNTYEDADVRKILAEINTEREHVSSAKKFHENLERIVRYYLQDSNYISPAKMSEANEILRESITLIESVSTTTDTPIDSYIKNIKEDNDYGIIQRFSDSTFTDNANISETLSYFSEDMYSLNEKSGTFFLLYVGDAVKKLSDKNLPRIYK